MTGGPHLSATAGEGRRRKSCWAGSVLFGLSWADGARTREKTGGRQRTSVNLGRDHNWAGREIEWLTSFFFFYFYSLPKTIKQNTNSNRDLNPSTQNKCTGKKATHTQLFI
jgi:hypothetical protein